jgi:ABC-type polysaccharide/polyol phosphate export permease
MNRTTTTSSCPARCRPFSHLKPLTYVLDAMRTFMLAGSTSTLGPSYDYAVILLTSTILVFIGARLYPHLAS